MTDESTARLVEDMRDEPLTRTTSRGGNHPLWIIGHLAVVEGSIPQILFGEPNPVEHWGPLFGQGSTPTDDAGAYPSFDEVLATYRDLRAKNLARLEEIGEAGLDRAPRAVPAGIRERDADGRADAPDDRHAPDDPSRSARRCPPGRRTGTVLSEPGEAVSSGRGELLETAHRTAETAGPATFRAPPPYRRAWKPC